MEALISENEWNKETIDVVYKGIEEKLKTLTVRRLRASSVELLVTNRYLDEDSSFYKTAEQYFDMVFAVNERLAAWLHASQSTENWLMDPNSKKGIYGFLNKFANMLNGVKEKLSASCESNRACA